MKGFDRPETEVVVVPEIRTVFPRVSVYENVPPPKSFTIIVLPFLSSIYVGSAVYDQPEFQDELEKLNTVPSRVDTQIGGLLTLVGSVVLALRKSSPADITESKLQAVPSPPWLLFAVESPRACRAPEGS